MSRNPYKDFVGEIYKALTENLADEERRARKKRIEEMFDALVLKYEKSLGIGPSKGLCQYCGRPIGAHRNSSKYCTNACKDADRLAKRSLEICPFAKGEIELDGGYQPDPGWGY